MELAGFWRRMDGEGELGFIGRRGPLPFGSSSWPRINYAESDGVVILLLVLALSQNIRCIYILNFKFSYL